MTSHHLFRTITAAIQTDRQKTNSVDGDSAICRSEHLNGYGDLSPIGNGTEEEKETTELTIINA